MQKLEIPLSDDLTRYTKERAIEAHLAPGEYVASLIKADQRHKATQQQMEEQLLAAQRSIAQGKGVEVTPESWKTLKASLHAQLN